MILNLSDTIRYLFETLLGFFQTQKHKFHCKALKIDRCGLVIILAM